MKIIDPDLLTSAELHPLQQLAASKVALLVCVSKNVQCVIRNFAKMKCNEDSIGFWMQCRMIGNTGFSDVQWQQLCDTVRNELIPINIPKLIIDIILEKMWPICYEIFKWILRHDADTGIDCTSKFDWSVRANINYEETAKTLIEDSAINILKRFKLACFYCLEADIRSLWELMDASEKRLFFIKGNLKKSNVNLIILYWSYNIQDKPLDKFESKKLNPTELFKYAVQNGYPHATKFFFEKLKKQVRNRMIHACFMTHLRELLQVNSVVKHSHYVTAYFLMSEIDERHCRNTEDFFMISLVFRHFLEWPFQNHFMTVIDNFKQYARGVLYIELLEAIFEKDFGCFKDYDYKKLFKEYWLQFPETAKSHGQYARVGCRMFLRFVKKHFGFVFDEKSYSHKSKFRAIVLERKISPEDISCHLKEKVEFFKFFIREGVVSKSAIRKFARGHDISGGMFSFGEMFASPPEEESVAILPDELDDISDVELDNIPYTPLDGGRSGFNAPLGELMYLMDSILGIV